MSDRYLGMDFTGLTFVEEQKLKGFFHKFTEEYYTEYKIGHIIFAAYAAIPTYINPDLLYKIWMNFKEYEWKNNSEQIHLVAVVDLINASFCEEIGPKLYKLNTGIKNALNEWLRNEVVQDIKKNASENDIAHFINAELKHVQKDYKLWGGDEYVFDQGLNADLLVYPERAMEKIKQVLYRAESDTEKLLAFNLLVDAKKKISTEINFDEITELGKGWKEYLLGKPTKLLKKLENLENSFLKDEPTSSLSMEITIPQEIVKEQTARKKKKRIYGVFVGVDEYEDTLFSSLDYCARDAQLIHDLLKNNIDEKKNNLDFKLLLNEEATCAKVEDCLSDLEDLDDGDTFVLYYSGHANDGWVDGHGRSLIFYDTRTIASKVGREVDNDMLQNNLEENIYNIIKEKNIHCILILDCSDVTEERKSKLNKNKLRNNQDLRGSLIIWDSAFLGTSLGNNINLYKTTGKFSNHLLDVLRVGGLYMSYNEIYEQLRLNILQQSADGLKGFLPRIESFPYDDFMYLKFLNNTENLYDNLEIHFNETRSQWEVNAGFNKGINSSIPLMPTILETDLDGRKFKWQVKKSYLDYASLENFKGDTSRKFKARLLQNSFKEILFFIDDNERFDERTRDELKGYLERRDIPLVEITEDKLEAKYVISHNNILGYFVYDPLFGETLSIIDLQDNIEEFIIHLEYLTQWEGLLQYSNLNSKLNPKDFQWALSLNEGIESQQFTNITNIDITVKRNELKKTFTKKIQSKESGNVEIKCTITFKDSLTNKELKKDIILEKNNNPIIDFELLKGFENSNFGLSILILDDNLSIEEMPTNYVYKGNDAIRRINYDYVNAVRSKLKKNKQLYLKIFLSNQRLNAGAFQQEGTNKDLESKNLNFSEQNFFDASEVDWISYTIPINVTLDERREELKVVNQYTESTTTTKKTVQSDKYKINSDEVKNLLGQGKLGEAIKILREHLLNTKKDDMINTILFIDGQYQALEQDNSSGVLLQERYLVTMSRITNSILNLLDKLENNPQ